MWKYNNRWVSEIHTPDCKFCFNNNEENWNGLWFLWSM
jgi:hypothetical protein